MEPVVLQRTFLLVAWTAPKSPFVKPPTGDLLKPFPFAGRYGFALLPYSPRCPLRLSTCFRAQLLDPGSILRAGTILSLLPLRHLLAIDLTQAGWSGSRLL